MGYEKNSKDEISKIKWVDHETKKIKGKINSENVNINL